MFKWLGDRLKKGVRDIGSGAKDIVRNNPEMLAALGALYGIPYLKGKGLGIPGGWDILGEQGILSKALGSLDKLAGPANSEITQGKGFLGTLQNIAGGILGGKEGGNKGISGILALLVKNELEKEKARALEGDRSGMFDVASEKFGGEFGLGDEPKKEWVFEDLQYDPATGKRYDKYDNGFQDYITDSDDRITNYAKDGGIAQLKMGGTGTFPLSMPFNPNNKISGILTPPQPILQRAYGGGTETQLFDPRMSGNQMMNQIKKNPGITDFFPPQFGHIQGAGGPKDDKIPAMLSDGEFVMTAKAVDNAGGPEAMYGIMNKLDPDSSRGKGII
jgi:hypothetical protein